jgi:glycoprotein endo-alpha-1,2-mannosidase
MKIFAILCFLPAVLFAQAPAAEKPLLIAHYMTWFGTPEISGQWYQWRVENWGMTADKQHYPDLIMPDGKRDIAAVDYPVIGPYDSTDEDLLEYHILLAKDSGIDGFMVNWYGFEDDNGKRHEDQGFQKLLKTAEKLDFKVCINLDDKCSFPPYHHFKKREDAVAYAIAILKKVMIDYGKSPAYLKIGRSPLFSNFGWFFTTGDSMDQTSFSRTEWEQIIAALKEYAPFFIHDHQWHWGKTIEEAGFISCADSVFPWVGPSQQRIPFYEESQKLLAENRIKMITGLANPGFDNTPCWGWGGGIAKIPRRSGQEYRDHFEECKRYNPGFIQLVTWNDFTEGSTIEPADTYGDLYLKITAEYANGWMKKNIYGNLLDLPARIYAVRKQLEEIQPVTALVQKKILLVSQIIDKAVGYVLSRKKNDAEKLLIKAESSLKEIRSALPEKQELEAALTSPFPEFFSGETGTLTLTVKNPFNDEFPVIAEIQSFGIPYDWFSGKEMNIRLKPGTATNLDIKVKIPENTQELYGKIAVNLKSYHGAVESKAVMVSIKKSYIRFDVGPVNLLKPGKSQELYIRIKSQIRSAAKSLVTFICPEDWKISPSSIRTDIPSDGAIQIPFVLTIPQKNPDKVIMTIKCVVNSNNYFIQEPYGVLNENGLGLLEDDINQDGVNEIVAGNSKMEVVMTGIIGGRILSIVNRSSGRNQLLLNYPEVSRTSGHTADKWTEYGGINDNFPADWPGLVWNSTWDVKVLEGNRKGLDILFSTGIQDGLNITRKVSLSAGQDMVKTEYEVANTSGSEREFVLSTHPDLAVGGSGGNEDLIIVPFKGADQTGMIKNNYMPTLTKKNFTPAENWILGYDTINNEYLGQIFDASRTDQIGVWEGGNFFTMEVFFKKTLLRPGEKAVFDLDYIVGTGEMESTINRMKELK